MYLNELSEYVLDTLKSKANNIDVPAKNINHGKIGESPAFHPFLRIFILPNSEPAPPGYYHYDIVIFAGVKENDPNTARIKSLEYAQRAGQVLEQNLDHGKCVYDYDIEVGGSTISYASLKYPCKLTPLL